MKTFSTIGVVVKTFSTTFGGFSDGFVSRKAHRAAYGTAGEKPSLAAVAKRLRCRGHTGHGFLWPRALLHAQGEWLWLCYSLAASAMCLLLSCCSLSCCSPSCSLSCCWAAVLMCLCAALGDGNVLGREDAQESGGDTTAAGGAHDIGEEYTFLS